MTTKKYAKKRAIDDPDPKVGTSIFIRKSQLKYLKDENLNISEIARDAIDSLIKKSKTRAS